MTSFIKMISKFNDSQRARTINLTKKDFEIDSV